MPNPIRHVALVTESDSVTLADTLRVASALNKQAKRDFNTLWDVNSTVSGFASLEDVPLDYWPMIVRDDIDMPGAAGVHLDKNGQPFALITSGSNWSLTASHECLEMLADPFGNRLIAGPSLKPGQGRVNYLVEVCDPSEARNFGYRVNGILVSDFYSPHFFDPVKVSGVRYSYTGAITGPRQVLKGGYISWHEPVSDHWWQQTFFGSQPTFRDLGVLARNGRSLREMIDELTSQHLVEEGTSRTAMTSAAAAGAEEEPTVARAAALHEQIDMIIRK